MGAVLIQIAVLDIVFSLDSVITAVGLVEHVALMAIAIILAVLVMLFAAKPIGDFVEKHTNHQDSCAFVPDTGRPHADTRRFRHTCPKGYIYFAMAFSVSVEFINLRMRKKAGGACQITRASERA